MSERLGHIDRDGKARMVDIGGKPASDRRAVASGRVRMTAATRALALGDGGPKGAVLETARLAGIQGGKRTGDLIPLCHPLPLDALDVVIEPEGEDTLKITAVAATHWKTGVEMEALTAVCLAGLTVIDMLKGVEKGLTIEQVRLEEKSGGKSGQWVREPS